MGNRLMSIELVSLLVAGSFIGIFSIIPHDVKAPGPTYIGGLISTDTTLTLVDSPYIINWNTMVEKGITLTIEPGVEVRFEDYYYLQIKGKLVAEGTEDDMILFTSNKTTPSPGDWNAIRFMDDCDNGSSIIYCKIEYSGGSFAWSSAINIEGGIPSITDNYITNCEGGICLGSNNPYQGTFYAINNTIKNNAGRGIIINEYASNIEVDLSDNEINNNSQNGIWIRSRRSSDELTHIKNNVIRDNTGRGISFTASNEYINVSNNLIINNSGGGIVFQAGNNDIPGVIEGNTIVENGDGIRIDGADSVPVYSWKYNNIYDNTGYNVENNDVNDWYLPNNWWGTTDCDSINQSIFDYYDDFNYGKIIYMPFLTGPVGHRSVKLKQGCNLISVPFIQPDESIDEVLSSISDEYYAVQWYDSSDTKDPWKHFHTSKPSHLNDLDIIDHTMAVFVYTNSKEDINFQFEGDQITENQKIVLNPGWNLVGYPSLTNYERTEALNNLTFNTHVDAVLTYNANAQKWQEVGPLDNFEMGKGYFIHAKMKCIWEVPL